MTCTTVSKALCVKLDSNIIKRHTSSPGLIAAILAMLAEDQLLRISFTTWCTKIHMKRVAFAVIPLEIPKFTDSAALPVTHLACFRVIQTAPATSFTPLQSLFCRLLSTVLARAGDRSDSLSRVWAERCSFLHASCRYQQLA